MPPPIKTSENKILNAALDYLDHGVSVIPVRKDKVPLIKWEDFQTRRATKEEVTEWWSKWPDANVGIITGKISGLTVVDVEAGGDISRFPATTTIQTGGGGWHLYYAYHPISNKARIFPLTDIRGDSGYVVAPPSVHSSGEEYKILNKMAAVPFPTELFEETVRSSGSFNKELTRLLNETIPEGERNNTATSICGKLLLRFKSHEWETQAWPLFQSWNATHNTPPLKDQELLTIFRSISQAETKRQLSGASVGEPILLEQDERFVINVPVSDGFAVFEFEDVEYGARNIECVVRCSIEMPDTAPRKFVQRINILSSSAKESFARQLKEAFPLGKVKAGWPLIFSQACELLGKALEKQSEEEFYNENAEVNTQYLIKPLVEEGVHNIIFGVGGSGKTYLSLGMAVSLALDKPFLEIQPEKQVNTLFVDYENNSDIWSSRITKILKGMGVDDISAIKKSLFYFRTKGAPIYDIKYQLARVIKRRSIGLIIIDSAALACGGEPENADTANHLLNSLSWLKTTTLLIAHETKNSDNKNKTPFGSIFWFNGARNIWNVSSKQEQDEPVSHVGLFHRKCNNDRISSPRAAVIRFGDGMVNIDFESNEDLLNEPGIKEQIMEELSNGVHRVSEIASNTGIKGTIVAARLQNLKDEGKVNSPMWGVWELTKAEEVKEEDGSDSGYY